MKIITPIRPHGVRLAALPLLALAGCASGPLRHATAEYGDSVASTPVAGQVAPRAASANQPPVYPTAMRRTATHGWVNLDCVIDETGHMLMANVRDSTNVAFNQPTLDAARDWTFEPGTRNGVASAMRVTLPVEFVIER